MAKGIQNKAAGAVVEAGAAAADNGRAANTTASYRSAWAAWQAWADDAGVAALPASPAAVAAYLAQRAAAGGEAVNGGRWQRRRLRRSTRRPGPTIPAPRRW